jgi:hypothetical protein
MMSNFTLMGKFHTLNLIHKISILQLCELLLLLLTTVRKREARKSLKRNSTNNHEERKARKSLKKNSTNNHESLPLQMQYLTSLHFSSFP